MTDVFTDDAPPIVDCDVLEAAKENIQPLAAGRRVTALSAILSTPHAQRETRLADARKRHRTNVELALEDDSDDAGCSTTSDEVSSSGSFNHASSSGYNGFYSGLPLRRAL